jgi:hypothetical protein
MEDREGLLRRDGTLVGLATAGLVNGMHTSPWFDVMAAPIAAILSGFYITSPVLLFYFVSLTVSVFTVMLAGIPAAIYEQSQGLTESNGKSLTIWLVAAIVLALPAFLRMIGAW